MTDPYSRDDGAADSYGMPPPFAWRDLDQQTARRRARDEDDDDEDDEAPRKTRRRARDDDEDDEDERPRKKKARAADDERPRKKKARDDDEDEDDEDDESEGDGTDLKWTRKRKQLNLVQLGLLFMFIAQFPQILAFLALFFVGFLYNIAITVSAERPQDSILLWIALVVLGTFTFLPLATLTIIPYLIGAILSCFVPHRAGARGLVMGALALVFLPLVLGVFCLILAFGGLISDVYRAQRLLYLLAAVSGVSFFVGFFTLMLYLKQLGHYLRDIPTGNTAAMLAGSLVLLVFFYVLLSGATRLYIATGMVIPFGGLLLDVGYIAWIGFLFRTQMRLFHTISRLRQIVYDRVYPPKDDDDE